MKFWDSSALIPLILDEPTSSEAFRTLRADRQMTTWWATTVECSSAIARSEREGRIVGHDATDAFAAFRLLRSGWSVVDPTARILDIAERLVRTHPLRAADGLQLAAAIVAADGAPGSLPFVTRDTRLADAAHREGFDIVTLKAT